MGFSAGYLALPRAPGLWGSLGPKALLGTHYGWNIGPLFALELGYVGVLMDPSAAVLSGLKSVSLNGVTLDMRVRLRQPRRFARLIPFLQAGLGVHWLLGTPRARAACESEKQFVMAQGGGLQLGGGLEFFLARFAVLGARVLYRPLFMSTLRGAPGGPSLEPEAATRKVHGVSAELSLTLVFPM